MKLSTVPLLLILFSLGCTKKDPPALRANELFYKAYELRDSGSQDSAFRYFNSARDLFLQAPDSMRAGISTVNMAIIASDMGDVFGSQELSLDAIAYFDESDPDHLPYVLSNYNNLGITSAKLKDYNRAILFYTHSLEANTDSSNALIIRNNLANAYRETRDYKAAFAIFKYILQKEKNPANYARALSNYAYTRFRSDPRSNASADLHRALHIRIRQADTWGLNSSYSHLAEYYMQSKPDSARYYSKQMLRVATDLKSADDRLEALRKLIPLSPEAEARKYFQLYSKLEDSIAVARSSVKNQFALIRYETEKHKADKLVLQRSNSRRNIGFAALLLLLLGGGSFALYWHRKRTRLMELASHAAIREGQLKTSKKVHDVVANGIYRIMSELENNKSADREKILDQMEDLYERSRDISYENEVSDPNDPDFDSGISRLLTSFATEKTRVIILGNTPEVWQSVSSRAKQELRHVIQELMVNMKKHSKASNAAFRFEKTGGQINIYYTDNGCGLSPDQRFNNGLRNTENRIQSIGGSITFGNGSSGGLTVHIQTPAAS